MRFLKAVGRAIRRFFLWLLMVALMVVLLVGGVTLFFYQNTGEKNLPPSQSSFGGVELQVNGYHWTLPVLGGVTQKELVKPEDLTVQDLGTFVQQPTLQLPNDLQENATIWISITDQNQQVVFAGTPEDFATFQFVQNGQYQGQMRIAYPPLKGKATGEYFYQFRFTLDLESEISISADTVYQGDVVAISVTGLPQGASIQVETELTASQPVSRYGSMMIYLAVPYNQTDKEYPIKVQAGGYTKDFTVQVLYNQFKKVSLETDTLAGSQQAVQQYQQVIWPLFETSQTDSPWSGVFQSPVEQPNDGVVLSDYGNFEYIADRTTPSRNIGVTYKCHADKPVYAPASGTVVYAGNLELTGGIVVIEHGGGLKSYLYHMGSVSVQQGQTVEKGHQIGTTSQLLQFDMRIGNKTINPNLAMNGKGGLLWR